MASKKKQTDIEKEAEEPAVVQIPESVRPIVVTAGFRYEALVKSIDTLVQNFDQDNEFVILIYGHKPEKQVETPSNEDN